jgi:broad specificity phosphatase PhoE
MIESTSVPDAPLTKLGREQSVELSKDTQEIQKTAELLVSSALRRPLQTMILGYPEYACSHIYI